jgi:hypothetical protein
MGKNSLVKDFGKQGRNRGDLKQLSTCMRVYQNFYVKKVGKFP